MPVERHPTAAARRKLSSVLAFEDNQSIQDWERYFADEHRISEFIELYSSGGLDDDQKYLLMDLILASAAFADEDQLSVRQWSQIDYLLLTNSALHERTIWEWADIDEETGTSTEDFQISVHMQQLLLKIFEAKNAPASAEEKAAHSDFVQFWEIHFPDQAPVSHSLRTTLPSRWVRFHSLPDSQRYANNDDDWQILLDRHNQLATSVLGVGSRCWLVLPRELDLDEQDNQHLAGIEFSAGFAWTDKSDPDFPCKREANAAPVTWQPNKFDELFKAIASWQEISMMLVSRNTGAIFAPYDGGMDLFLPTGKAVANFKELYAQWLPTNPAGL